MSFHFRKSCDSAVRHWWLRREVSLQRKMSNSVQGGRTISRKIPIGNWTYSTICGLRIIHGVEEPTKRVLKEIKIVQQGTRDFCIWVLGVIMIFPLNSRKEDLRRARKGDNVGYKWSSSP